MTISEILEHVGGHPIKAAEALREELSRSNPRKTLVAQLQELIGDPEMPTDLGPAGVQFWRECRDAYSFRVDELVLLERACHIIDDLAELDLEKQALTSRTTRGSQGQLVTHPVIDQITKAHADLRATIKALNFPDEEAARSRSTQARKAAKARWGG